jgi:hypothetical protein
MPQDRLTPRARLNNQTMEAEKEYKMIKALLKSEEELIKEYEKELKRLRMKNLKIKLHMEVLVHNPFSKTASEIRKIYSVTPDFSESIIHFN